MSLMVAWTVFFAAATIIALVGCRMTAIADRLADRTGLGEAVVGATLLGAATSLPGITTSVTAALDGKAELAFSNAIGGIAAQTMFLAIADLTYRHANLEHAAASLANILQAVLLVFILSLLILAIATPPITVAAIHPITPLLFIVYIIGLTMVKRAQEHPMWSPRSTDRTQTDQPDEEQVSPSENRKLWLGFGLFALLVVTAGIAISKSVSVLVDEYAWLEESAAGAFLTAIATSLPELVTSVAAVRRGALTLAVGGIVGGNCFDTLFAAVADLAYRDGSIYHAATATAHGPQHQLTLIAATIAMTALLLGGLLYREKRGLAGIGFESVGIIIIYMLLVGVLTLC